MMITFACGLSTLLSASMSTSWSRRGCGDVDRPRVDMAAVVGRGGCSGSGSPQAARLRIVCRDGKSCYSHAVTTRHSKRYKPSGLGRGREDKTRAAYIYWTRRNPYYSQLSKDMQSSSSLGVEGWCAISFARLRRPSGHCSDCAPCVTFMCLLSKSWRTKLFSWYGAQIVQV